MFAAWLKYETSSWASGGGAGELFLPEGVHYRPLRKALRGPGLWGKCRFPIDNDHDEL